MTLRYEYSTAESYYVLLTFLVFLLLPATYLHLTSAIRAKPASSITQLRALADDPKPTAKKPGSYLQYLANLSLPTILLGVGWFALLVVVIIIATSRTVVTVWDPHSVLGISSSASRPEIKKAYRQLSLTLHPDKVPAAQRKEAEINFVSISKAYKVLTNAKARKNFEMYGNPDGPQATSFGIALPPWMTNPAFVIIAYLSMLVGIGASVYRFFTYGSVFGQRVLENGLMKLPMEKLAQSFKQAKDNSPPMTADQILLIVAGTARAHHPDFVFSADHAKLLPKSARDVSSDPVMLALQAHMHRIVDGGIPAELINTLELTCETVISLAVQRGRMVDVPGCISAQRSIIMATKPNDSLLLALPHMTPQLVAKLGAHLSPMGLVKQGRAFLDAKLGAAVPESVRDDLWATACGIPYVQIVGCSFSDMSLGATPGNELPAHSDSDIIACTLVLSLTTVKDQVAEGAGNPKKKGALKKTTSSESSMTVSDSVKVLPPAFVHAPYFPRTKRNGIWIFLSETTRPKIAPILNCTFVALDQGTLADAWNEMTGEVKVRFAIRGPHYAGPLNITASVFSIPHPFIDESRSFKLKLEPWTKKNRAISGSDEASLAAKDMPAKYPAIDIPLPSYLSKPAGQNELDFSASME